MKKTFISAIVLLCGLTALAQSSKSDYIGKYKDIAIREMIRAGVPASIKLGQACLESRYGLSELSRKSNNHFGIKCRGGWSGKSVRYNDDAPQECFRAYKNVEESYIDHSEFLHSNSRYDDLFLLDITDYKKWAYGLKKAGYATDPKYPEKLISIIEEHQLYRFDADAHSIEKMKRRGYDPKANAALSQAWFRHTFTMHNGLNTVTAKKGETVASIADDLHISRYRLRHYNDYNRKRQPADGEILYIESKWKKLKSGPTVHIAGAGESMHYISQAYGIRLSELCKLNDFGRNDIPPRGTKIRLR
ncbi:MAG: glucosaminidase domain-containing protein [Bacteroidales bacterium]|jgi:LysM repeat protein|nr:glucosaminidase domain-containing protein [Bacteroidales bacterium]